MTEGLIKKVIRSKRKTLALQVTPDASLIIRAPERTSLETIQKAVLKKLPWILEKQSLARATYRQPVEREFVNGEGFLYLGEWYKLYVVEGSGTPLVFNSKEFWLSKKYLSEARQRFEEWYKDEAFDVINRRAKRFAEVAGINYATITITSAKKRWGSCGPKGTLNFSWRLIMAPLSVIDYVIVHELVHFEERNHSTRFWQKVRVLLPHYQQARDWLQNNHYLLMP